LFCFVVWGLNSGLSPWATLPALFLWRVFWNKVLWIICPVWFQTAILLISTSWVARITGISHWHPPPSWFKKKKNPQKTVSHCLQQYQKPVKISNNCRVFLNRLAGPSLTLHSPSCLLAADTNGFFF
jgi:hypothetical protein